MRSTLPALAAAFLAGCAATPPPMDDVGGTTPAYATWRGHEHLGPVLVDEAGLTLYVHAGHAPCVGACASDWPPALAPGPDVDGLGGRLSAVGDPPSQLAIDGRALHRYVEDAAPGDALGQAREAAWFVVRESDAPGTLNVDFLDGPGEFEVAGRDVAYADDATGFFASPATAGARPGVVMIHEWWGLNEHVRAMALALASHGYAVLAVDLFGGSVATTPDEALAQVGALDQEKATANLRAAVRHLREDAGAPSVASLGWCFGGGQSLQLAVSGEPLDATVVYYGSPVTDESRLAAVDWPLLGVFAAEDRAIPLAAVRAFESALANASVEAEVHVFEDVGHAFANPSGEAYAPEAAMEAWARTLDFLAETLQHR